MQLVEILRRIWRRLVGGGGEQEPPAAPQSQSPEAEEAEAEPPLSEIVALRPSAEEPAPEPAEEAVLEPAEEPELEPAEEVATEEAEEAAVDDLTAIRGIGAATRERLNAAGIKSYAQLAAAVPEDVRKVLNKQARNAKVEDWIRQARELAAKE